MLHLTKAQVRFWLIKGLNLFAVILLVVIAYIHFNMSHEPEPQTTQKVAADSALPLPSTGNQQNDPTPMNPQDIHNMPSPAEEPVIPADTADVDKNLTDQLLQMVTAEDNIFMPSPEDNALLEKLYEEDLPDDVLENTTQETITREPDNRPRIIIVIDDMGISAKRTADIISLEYPITTAFLTYGRNLDQQVDAARAKGHEIMLHTPMEPFSDANVAPDVLTTQMSPDEIKQNLKIMLAKFHNIKGINNHMGSKLTEDHARMQAVMDVLKEQNLFFLDSKTSAKSCAEQVAKENGLHYAHRHVFLDNTNEKNYVLEQLKRTENIAVKNGYAIAIGHPKTGTYAALKEWLPTLDSKGLHLISMSQLMQSLYPNKD